MDLVFDVGATHIRMALVHGNELQRIVRLDTDPRASGFEAFLAALDQMVGDTPLGAIAGCMPGQFEGSEGRLVLAPNLPHWMGRHVKAELKERFECPVYIANDVTMGGLGEAHAGAGSVHGVMAYFTISTGVNAVRLVDGLVDTTISRYEIGKQLILDDGGRLHSLESLTGGAALEQRAGKPPRQVRNQKTWKTEDSHLAIGVYNTIVHWDPDLIVFGGSMMRDVDLLQVAARLERLPAVLPRWPKLVRAKLRDVGGLYGAKVWLQKMR